MIREVNLHVTVTEHTSYENERIKYNATYIWIKSDGSPVPLSKSGNWAGPDDSGDISFSVWLGEGHEDLVFPQHHLHTGFFWHAVVTDSMRSTFLQVLHVKRHRKWFQIWLVCTGEISCSSWRSTACNSRRHSLCRLLCSFYVTDDCSLLPRTCYCVVNFCFFWIVSFNLTGDRIRISLSVKEIFQLRSQVNININNISFIQIYVLKELGSCYMAAFSNSVWPLFFLCFSGNLLHSHTPCGRARERMLLAVTTKAI